MWENDRSDCLGCPHLPDVIQREFTAHKLRVCLSNGLKKSDFHTWAKGNEEKLVKIVPWLQFRVILLYFYLMCHGDSSQVALSEDMGLHVPMI